jgi:Xaa-Pro aminopeptidase
MIPIKEVHLKEVAARARLIMERDNVDAIVASSCENFYYLSGFPSMFMYTFRMNEIALAVMFRDPSRNTVIIMNEFEAAGIPEDLPQCEIRTFPTWIDIDDPLELKGTKLQSQRPVFQQAKDVFGILHQVLDEYGISGGRAAVELSSMRYLAGAALLQSNPSMEWMEAASIFTELRVVKTSWEVEQLRKSCAYAEYGIAEAVRGIGVGITAASAVDIFKTALLKNNEGFTARFNMISIGANFAPAHIFDTYQGVAGDLIKFDVGVDVAGYGSDIARTFVLGSPSDKVKRVYGALRAGHDRLLQMVEPEMPMSTIFNEVMSLIRRSGLDNYNRGHLGHSIGLSLATEEAPFVSSLESTVLSPGMLICLETPYYGYGVGSIMIEDMVLVTENGCEPLNKLSKDLISL